MVVGLGNGVGSVEGGNFARTRAFACFTYLARERRPAYGLTALGTFAVTNIRANPHLDFQNALAASLIDHNRNIAVQEVSRRARKIA